MASCPALAILLLEPAVTDRNFANPEYWMVCTLDHPPQLIISTEMDDRLQNAPFTLLADDVASRVQHDVSVVRFILYQSLSWSVRRENP